HLGRLTALYVDGIGNAGLAALAASPTFANLTTLGLRDSWAGPGGVEALAASPHFARLRELDLSLCRLQPEGLQALAASPHLTNLVSLTLEQTVHGPELGRGLAAWRLPRLAVLDLRANGILDTGLHALATAPHLAGLRSLNLSGCGLTDAG